MPFFALAHLLVDDRFNPHPANRPGDASCIALLFPDQICFNPHPANRPGDASASFDGLTFLHVSIRTRPTGRVMPGYDFREDHEELVSIRTRPTGRVMQFPYPITLELLDVSIRTRPTGRVMQRYTD